MIAHRFRQPRKICSILIRRFEASSSSQIRPNQRSALASDNHEHITGVDLIKQIGDESQQKNLYPILRKLGITTESKKHSFNIDSDTAIKFIKLGAVNRNLAIQYCHYLVDLCSEVSDKKEFEYYAARVSNLTQYLLKNYKDVPAQVKIELCVNVASTSEDNCSLICNRLCDEYELWSQFSTIAVTGLLTACYKFKMWDVASIVLDRCWSKNIYWTTFETLGTSMNERTSSDIETPEKKDSEKQSLIDHLAKLFKFTRERRIQFVTRQPEVLVQGLESLMADVFKRPTLKMSGRCTHCNTHMPLYDNKAVLQINNAIKQVLDKRLMGNLHLHSSPGDINNFYQFLENLHRADGKPIDCVIDGLNLAYKNTQGHVYTTMNYGEDATKTFRRHDTRFQVQILANAIIRSNLLTRFRKILVIGKAHMKGWPGLEDFFKKNNIHFYASDNQTKDDLFMLYASTLSPKTFLITNDFLRDHLALLDGDQKILLERYIDTHQVWIENKTLRAIWPTPFEKLPHADDTCNHFHIPVIDYNKIDVIGQHEPPAHLNNKLLTWLCCSKTEQSEKKGISEADTSCEDGSDSQVKKAN